MVLHIANSSRKCNSWIDVEKYLIRGIHAKALSRTVIEFIHNGLKVLVGNRGEIVPLGKVLSDKTVGVLIESSLP